MSDGPFTIDSKLDLHLGDIADALRDAAAKAVELACEHVLQVSDANVPHQEGVLERSGQYDVDRNRLVGAVFYDTPYAVRQHEDMTLRHDNGRSAKYLENALTGEASTVRKIAQQTLKRATGG